MSPKLQAMRSRLGLNDAPSVTKLGPSDTIAGYATEKYVITTPATTMEVWAAPALSVPQPITKYFARALAPAQDLLAVPPLTPVR